MSEATAKRSAAAGQAGARLTSHVLPAAIGEPLTERLLGRLPVARPVAIVAWSAIALVMPAVLWSALIVTGETDRVADPVAVTAPQVVLAYAVLLLLVGTGRVARRARALEPDLIRLTSSGDQRVGTPGAGTATDDAWSTAGPVLLTMVGTALITAGSWVRFGGVAAVLVAPLLALALLPILTFLWTYLRLLLALDRLGRVRLALDPFPGDRELGLRSVGSLAFTAIAVLLAAILPVLAAYIADITATLAATGVVVVALVTFVLSLWRLHLQMAAAKAAYVADARAAYVAAYAPYRADPTLERLQAQAGVLGAAQSLEERASRIREWPVEERLVRVLGFFVAAVASTVIGRVVYILWTS